MKAASTILAPTPSPGRLLTIHVGLKPVLRAHTVEDETTSSQRKRSSTRVNPKALNFGTLQFCRWDLDKVPKHAASSSKRRRMTASGTPLLHIPHLLRTDQLSTSSGWRRNQRINSVVLQSLQSSKAESSVHYPAICMSHDPPEELVPFWRVTRYPWISTIYVSAMVT
jgi:hypothetical protein